MARRELIEQRAQRLLDAIGIESTPVPVKEVAAHLEIEIEYADLGEGCSGVLVREGGQGKGVIGVNWADHENRQRFTIAHEIGHYILHEDNDAFVDAGYSINFRATTGSGTPRQEREANWFAAALLMPRAQVVAAFQSCEYDPTRDDDDLRALAAQFGVSPQAMAIRLSVMKPSSL